MKLSITSTIEDAFRNKLGTDVHHVVSGFASTVVYFDNGEWQEFSHHPMLENTLIAANRAGVNFTGTYEVRSRKVGTWEVR